MNLGAAIRKIRKEKRYLQQTVAAKSFISIQCLSKIERGERNPTPDTLIKIGKALGVSRAELWFESLEEWDIAPEKRKTFKLLRPLLSELLK